MQLFFEYCKIGDFNLLLFFAKKDALALPCLFSFHKCYNCNHNINLVFTTFILEYNSTYTISYMQQYKVLQKIYMLISFI